ncbi:D-threo-aldose 1-dehydrogenase [Nesterenkonia halotolerans]|uniref:D-threo-aldose 1-dehydrogenase n=2 Tax=Nesterenkonia halotolerans TaxID=225325 RepID=A0ABR9J7B7_9MICC|nr:D-threo-aldose 1-dehydrogenase [Nesterenkonia halotolerans]
MFNKTSIQPVTLGTTGLGQREGADASLATALLASPVHQIDTANMYANGSSEALLGEAIHANGGLPSHKLIFSKVDQDPTTGQFDGDRVKRSFEETMARLGLETLPLLHFHDPYTIGVAEAMAPRGAVEALVSLREEGLVGAIGIAAGQRDLVEQYVSTGVFDAVLTHNRYTLVDRSAEEILRLATERNMMVFNAAPFGGGILARSGPHGAKYGYRTASTDLLIFIERLHEVCAAHSVNIAAAALHFSLKEPRIHSTIVGIYSHRRLEELLTIVKSQIPDTFWESVEALGTPPASPTD